MQAVCLRQSNHFNGIVVIMQIAAKTSRLSLLNDLISYSGGTAIRNRLSASKEDGHFAINNSRCSSVQREVENDER